MRQVLDLYVKFLKVLLFLAMGAGFARGGIGLEMRSAKNTLIRGLAKIPEVGRLP